MSKPPQTKTPAEVIADFRARGQSVRAWARAHGYSDRLVYALLYGRNKGNWGTSHEIAVRLGLKHGVIGAASQNPTDRSQ